MHGIRPFELVVSNLYPFEERPEIETIDIGGPAMTRAAAKNHAWVTIVTHPDQYGTLLTELHSNDGTVGEELRRDFALAAFARTAAYDAAIVQWLQSGELLPEHLVIALDRTQETLRYGENPHQQAARYRRSGTRSWWDDTQQHAGVALSYLNIYDADAAWKLVHDLGDAPACAIIKHANPCGVAVDDRLDAAYQRALECDERSAFGGIVALNRPIDADAAEAIVSTFIEAVIAPSVDAAAHEVLAKKANMRVVTAGFGALATAVDMRSILGAMLSQERDAVVEARQPWTAAALPDGLRVVTKRQPSAEEWEALRFAWRICAHVKSNAVIFTDASRTLAIGAGQMSRVDAVNVAVMKAQAAGRPLAGSVAASDAFFPFRDGLDAVAKAGATAVVHPGGSKRDEEVIAAADEHGLAMVVTGERHFRH
jgi:phosphoribosylaminoimidazolecarboxamide formyltransferase/IMP cyclohydrolase